MAFRPGQDLEIYRGNYGAPQPASPSTFDLLEQRKNRGKGGAPMQAPTAPAPAAAAPQIMQEAAQAQPEAGAASLSAVAGAPMGMEADLGFTGGEPGMLRPNLARPLQMPDDGGLRALQRKVY